MGMGGSGRRRTDHILPCIILSLGAAVGYPQSPEEVAPNTNLIAHRGGQSVWLGSALCAQVLHDPCRHLLVAAFIARVVTPTMGEVLVDAELIVIVVSPPL
jgi:hypothetical protein